MGLGLHGGGAGVAKFFCEQGARVLVTDLKTEEQLKESLKKLRGLKIEYILGSHRQKDFIEADLVVKNPAVPQSSPYLKIAADNKVPVKNDIQIFFDLCPAEIVGITGTKGKSTVSTLIYLLLKSKNKNTFLAGNIGVSPLELLEKIRKTSVVVLELSSFELEELNKSPGIAVFTNLLQDHLDRYNNFAEYAESKNPIFKFQKKNDILILNYDDPAVRKIGSLAPSRVYFYSKKPLSGQTRAAAFIKNGLIYFGKEEKAILAVDKIALRGEHNLSNVLAAVSAACIMGGIKDENIKKVLKRFNGIPFRQEFIEEINGIKYFNDTAATMPGAVIEAINFFSEECKPFNVILIAGGQNKGLDYEKLAEKINGEIKNLVLLPGTASDEIKKHLKAKVNLIEAPSLKGALEKAALIARKGDIILFSPGAASFNLFKNEFDRGRQFNQEIKKLGAANTLKENNNGGPKIQSH